MKKTASKFDSLTGIAIHRSGIWHALALLVALALVPSVHAADAHGALAIDENQGDQWGWSAGYGNLPDAQADSLAGDSFRDCTECPEMVVLGSGSYRMGSADGNERELPVHAVTIGAPFALGKYEVTFEEWDACVRGGGCPRGEGVAADRGWGRGRRPVIRVSWDDAQRYVRWLSGKTGKSYRLPSESEWEYAARSGTDTAYSWGDGIGRNRANCRGCGSRWDDKQTAPVGSFGSNGWGLHDMHGNVFEWVEDCWNVNYKGAPRDGSAWRSGECSVRVLRGGSWFSVPSNLRAAIRFWVTTGNRNNGVGFRVAQTLTP